MLPDTKWKRIGDQMIKTDTTTYPITVEWLTIFKAVKVTPDEWADMPWADQDGLEHTRDNNGRIAIPWDTNLETYYRDRGASRQVAKQLTAHNIAQRREYIAAVYRDGHDVWHVSCEYRGFSASIAGVDGYEYAIGECAVDIAREIAAELRGVGFAVIGEPLTVNLARSE